MFIEELEKTYHYAYTKLSCHIMVNHGKTTQTLALTPINRNISKRMPGPLGRAPEPLTT